MSDEQRTIPDMPAIAADIGDDLARGINWDAVRIAEENLRLRAEVARMRGLNAELLEAGKHLAGYLDSFFGSHMQECGRFKCLKRWDAVAGGATESGNG